MRVKPHASNFGRFEDQNSVRGFRVWVSNRAPRRPKLVAWTSGLLHWGWGCRGFSDNFCQRTLQCQELEGVSRCCDDSCSKVSGFFQQLFSFTLAFKAAVHNRSAAINPVTNACSLKSSHAKPRLELQANAESLDREPLNRHPKCSVESACRQLCIGWRMAYDPLSVAP